MPAARQAQPHNGPLTNVIIFAAAIAAAVIGTYFGYPGFVALPVGVAVAAWMATPAELTGKKDASGFPTAASPAEELAMNRYRMWGDLKWKAFMPSTFLLPGWPVRMWWLVSLPVSAAAAMIPTAAFGDLGRLFNAIGVFLVINTVNGAIRRWAAPMDPCVGPTVDDVRTAVTTDKKFILAAAGAVAALVAVFLAALIVINKTATDTLLTPVPPFAVGLTLGLLVALVIVTVAVRNASLVTWRTMVRVRAEWQPRWDLVKLEHKPRLLAHEQVGSVQVDTFETNPAVGVMGVLPMLPKIAMAFGTTSKLSALECPTTDSQGQPIQGTTDPLRMRILTYDTEDLPDVTNPDVNPDVANLFFGSVANWVSDSMGAGRWVFLEAHPLHTPDSQTAAWALQYAAPAGPPFDWMRDNAMGELSANSNAQVVIDHKQNIVYMGALHEASTTFEDPGVQTKIHQLVTEDEWSARWANTLKMGAIRPRPEHGVYQEAKVGSTTLHRQPFVVQQGLDPLDFFKLEPKIATTLAAAPFVSVTGFEASGRRSGERHAQAFSVTWSGQNSNVPANPDTLAPEDGLGPQWVLSGRINQAFDVSRLARPEVYEVRALTERRSRGHIWELKLRLYGGVTLAEVRTAAEKIRQAMGSGWLRVAAAPDGCVIVAGAHPHNTNGLRFAGAATETRPSRPGRPARPPRADAGEVNPALEKKNRDYITRLDWEQAFYDAKAVGVGGGLPVLVRSSVLPRNEQVQVLDFKLPAGLARSDVKEAVPKLITATANIFVEVRDSPDGADHVRILVSRENPLPTGVGFDWAFIDESDGIPFASGIEGEPVVFDPKDNPHILLAGVTGAGKSVLAQAFLYGALVHGAQLYVIDPVKGGADFMFAKEHAQAFASTPHEAAAVMRAVYAQVQERKLANAAAGVGSFSDLQDPPPRIFIMIDEFTSLMGQDQVPPATDDPDIDAERDAIIASNRAKTDIGVIAGKIAREARSAGVHLLLGTQKLTAKMLDSIPGANDLKDLTLDTMLPVPVSEKFPLGWARNGDLEVGDLLYTPNGGVTPIVSFSEVFTENTVLEVTFDDGQRIKAGSGHWWEVSPADAPTTTQVLTTEELASTLTDRQWTVRTITPFDGADAELPVAPYVLGVSLASGPLKPPSRLRSLLRKMDVLDRDRIPAEYLRASLPQRLALLQGLMDHDGTVEDGSYRLNVATPALASAATELLRSAGVKVPFDGTQTTLTFRTDLPVFRLPDTDHRSAPATADDLRHRIVSIQELPTEPTRCIAVIDESHLFLAAGFIPTHNTNLARTLLGKTSAGDRASALRAFQDAPDLGGDVPKGRGLYEPLTSTAHAIQVWYASQEELKTQLTQRRAPLPESSRLDLTPFLPKQPSDQSAPVQRAPRTPPLQTAAPEEVKVAELEFSLDDLAAFTDDEPADEVPTVDESATDTTIAEEAPVYDQVHAVPDERGIPVPVEQAPTASPAPGLAPLEDLFEQATAPVAPTPTAAPTPPPAAASEHALENLFEQPATAAQMAPPVPVRPTPPPGVLMFLDAAYSPEERLWEYGTVIPLPARRTTETDQFGWWKLQLALTAVTQHPGTTTVLWVGPDVHQTALTGHTNGALVAAVLAQANIRVMVATAPPGTPVAPVNPAPAATPAPQPAASAPVTAAPAPAVTAPALGGEDLFDSTPVVQTPMTAYDDLF
jgi:hypothetical protein